MSVNELQNSLDVDVDVETETETKQDGRSGSRTADYPQPVDEKGNPIPFDHPVELESLVDPETGKPWKVFKETQFVDPADFLRSTIHRTKLELAAQEKELEKLLAMGSTFEERQAALSQLKALEKATALLSQLKASGVDLSDIAGLL